MKKTKLSSKVVAMFLTLTTVFSIQLPITVYAVADEETTEEFHYLSIEEMHELSNAELAEYCR